jgi:hypothetical protein
MHYTDNHNTSTYLRSQIYWELGDVCKCDHCFKVCALYEYRVTLFLVYVTHFFLFNHCG